MLEGKSVLVTGGTGSMGRALVRRILRGEIGIPGKVIVFSRDEAKQHEMRAAYLNYVVATDDVLYSNFTRALEFRIGDVRSYADIAASLRDCDIVVNTAALKQVPVCEYFPHQALLTNCMGAENIVRAIVEHRLPVQTVVGVSTDKAVLPINVMGMSKAIQERILITANLRARGTRFICVRYGNVIASRGSVIPLFRQQILSGAPVTITAPEMTRFMLSIDDAVETIFAALKHAAPGEIFVPRTVSARVKNIAKAMIGDRKNEMKIIGVRPGEKIHEAVISLEESRQTVARGGYFAIRPMLPELLGETSTERPVLKDEFSSRDHVISLEDTAALLRKHNLLPEQSDASFDTKF